MKVNYSLLKEIYGSPWFLSDLGKEINAPILFGIFNDRIEISPEPVSEPNIIDVSAEYDDDEDEHSTNTSTGKIGVVGIKGTLTKEDQFCGPAGTKTIGRWLQENDSNPDITSHLIVFDTPGGSVNGTEELGNIIKNLQKPKVAFVEDLCCSAGMWLASYCDEIVANNTTCVLGSIGVMLTFADVQPYYENMGVKFHNINAPQSSDKNKIYKDLKAGEYDEYKETVLRPLADKFINVIKTNRPTVTDDQLTGKVYFAQDCVGTLIDTIGDMSYAVKRSHSLYIQQSGEEASNNIPVVAAFDSQTPKQIISMNIEGLTRVAGADISVTENGVVLSAEQVTAVEAFITAADQATASAHQQENRIQELETEVGTSADTITAHEATIAERDATIAQLQTQVEELSGKPGAETTTAVIDADGGSGSDGEELPFMRLQRLRAELGK